MNIRDIVCSFRTNLEKIAVGITDNVAHFVISGGPGKTQGTIRTRFNDIVGTYFGIDIDCSYIVTCHEIINIAGIRLVVLRKIGIMYINIIGARGQ